jgi:MFS family permease
VSAVFTLPPALLHRDFRRLWTSMLCSGLAMQMAAVAIGWQVYSIHHSAFDLGLIGLAEFAPVPLLALPAGQLADRLPRVAVVTVWGFCDAAVMGLLLFVTLSGAHQLWQFVVLAALTGVLAAVGNPAGRSLVPELVESLEPPPPKLESLLGGIRFIRSSPVILGAITLDLFAVLFGGSVALLPLFAQSVLHTGPFGLGVLRSAVAVGALIAALRLARKPLGSHAGRTLLFVVGAFGASMIVFGLSRWFWLSALALAVSGFVDMISMNIRATAVALATPNELRGRVNAVEGVFIGASNELGAFESGAAAALLGAVPAVVAGGALTIGLALVWPKVFPDLSRIDRLEELSPAAAGEVLVVGAGGPAAAPQPAD